MIELPVHYRQRIVAVTLVDDADVEWLSQWRWLTAYVHRLTDEWSYVYRSFEGGSYALARQVMGVAPGDKRIVHHVSEDRFDNRRANLLVCADAHEHWHQPHARRGYRPRSTPRPKFAHSVPWSRELFEEAA